MKNNLYQVGSLLLVIMLMVTSVSCSNKVETTYDNLPNSKPNPQNGDLVQVVEGILPDYSVNDLIKLSEIVVIGSVTEILPAQKGIRKESGTNLIYTDVVITPDRILNGKCKRTNRLIQCKYASSVLICSALPGLHHAPDPII